MNDYTDNVIDYTESNYKARQLLLKTPLCSRREVIKVRGNRKFRRFILKELTNAL
jgi:hypothetical protein